MRFEGKTVVVTGASSGMGREIALRYAQEGATVVAVARRKERLDALAEQASALPGKILAYPGDVSSQEVNEGMIDYAVKETGKLDILVNNAGVLDEFRPIGEVTNEMWDKVIGVNLVGPMYAMRKAVQVMAQQENGGNILNVASIGGINGGQAGAAYTASKHAIAGLTKNTAFMYTEQKIRCNAICPGQVETEVMSSMGGISQQGMARIMGPLDRTIKGGRPEDIASAVLFITSDDAKFMNGSLVVIDGGVTSH